MKALVIILSLFVLAACGQKMQSFNGINSATYEASDILGKGSYTTKASTLVSVDDVENMTDDEIVDNHIKIMEELIEHLKNEDRAIGDEEKKMKEELIKDLEARIKELKGNEDARAQFAKEMRKMAEEIKNGDLPRPEEPLSDELGCKMLKDLLDQGLVPSEIRDQEEKRYNEDCQ